MLTRQIGHVFLFVHVVTAIRTYAFLPATGQLEHAVSETRSARAVEVLGNCVPLTEQNNNLTAPDHDYMASLALLTTRIFPAQSRFFPPAEPHRGCIVTQQFHVS